MSQEPTKIQQAFAEKIYVAGCKFLRDHIEEICTNPIERHCSVNAISDVLASFSQMSFITDEQHQFLVKVLNGCLEYEIHKFNKKE